MNSQVYLNPTRLSILSIPRSKYWLFLGSILQMLHQEARKSSNEEDDDDVDSDSDDDSDDDVPDDEDDDTSSNDAQGNHDDDLAQVFSDGDESAGTTSSNDDEDDDEDERSNISAHLLERSISNARRSLSKDRSSSLAATKIDNSSKTHPYEDLSMTSPELGPISTNNSDQDEDENFFFHVAFTPIECTIICSTRTMTELFQKPLAVCHQLQYNDVKVIDQSFLSLQVDSDGSINNSLRILELTKPLSENGISLFFISSHFSDIVLIPFSLKERVIKILSKQNFQFSDVSNSYIATEQTAQPIPKQNDGETDNNVKPDHDTEPSDAPGQTSPRRALTSLEYNTFKLFKSSNIKPKLNTKFNLLLTGARPGEAINTIQKTVHNLSSNNIPGYFAITRTSINEVSLILPKSSQSRRSMGFKSSHTIGSTQDVIVPITVDFSKLPLDSTGIVAGLASKIVNGIDKFPSSSINYPFEMNYLSMARSGVIMIPKENLTMVSQILKGIDYDRLDDEYGVNDPVIKQDIDQDPISV